jgi:hypothetical protein
MAAWLFNSPQTETDYSSLARPLNVPMPLSRRFLANHLGDCYPHSVAIEIATKDDSGEVVTDPVLKPVKDVLVSELGDAEGGGSWTRTPTQPGQVAIDPQLGRLTFAAPLGDREVPLVTFHYGFGGDLGGGEYERSRSLSTDLEPMQQVANVVRGGLAETKTTIQEAIEQLPQGGVVEIVDNGRYAPPVLTGGTRIGVRRLEIRAANKRRPVVQHPPDAAADTVAIEGQLQDGKAFVELTLDGLLIAGSGLKVKDVARLRLRHCTLVPGLAWLAPGKPGSPDEPSLTIETAGTAGGTSVEIDRCIVGALRIPLDSTTVIRNSIVDATSVARLAYASPELGFGGSLHVENSTIVGRVLADDLPLASNSIFLASAAGAKPIEIRRRQQGCVRFCYVPRGSLVPRRHRCLPTSDSPRTPVFVSLQYGEPGYGRLSLRCAASIRRGADDESELGAMHDRFEPLRLDHLMMRLNEYLRFGMEAGAFPVIFSDPPAGA